MERSMMSEQSAAQTQTETVLETDVTDSGSQVRFALLRHSDKFLRSTNIFCIFEFVKGSASLEYCSHEVSYLSHFCFISFE